MSTQLSKQPYLGAGVGSAALSEILPPSKQPSVLVSTAPAPSLVYIPRLSPAFFFYSAVIQHISFCVLTCKFPWEELASRFE